VIEGLVLTFLAREFIDSDSFLAFTSELCSILEKAEHDSVHISIYPSII